jgi:IS5 family transposase
VNEPCGLEARTRRNRDGEWAKKCGKSYYGHKLHTITDMYYGLIRRLEITTVEIHDSLVDLSEPGEVVYRDRGYFEVSCKGYNIAMKRAVREHSLGIRDKLRNKRIACKISAFERPYAVIKNIIQVWSLISHHPHCEITPKTCSHASVTTYYNSTPSRKKTQPSER